MKFLAATFMALAVTASVVQADESLTQANATRVLRAEAGLTPGNVKDATIATMTIAQALAPVIAGMSNKKECHQVACWVSTSTEACAMAAANQVQRELMRGRNSFGVESTGPTGMWVRYWRTKFTPPDRGDVADGKCGAGTRFVVTNCQSTKDNSVHC